MTIYEVTNIEHCTVREVGNPVSVYVITCNDGWYIHKDDGIEENVNMWKTATTLRAVEDPAILTIVAEADLPEGAEICGTVGNETVTE